MIRPQRNAARDAVDLSGLWRIRFDPADEGDAQGWAAGVEGGHAIAVPGSWNEQLAEVGAMTYVGAAWLQTDIFIPLHAAGRRVSLRFGSADYHARVFVDGRLRGASAAAHLPFDIVLDDAAPGTTARLVVCVDNRLPPDSPTPPIAKTDYVAEGRLKDEYLPAVRFDFYPYGGLARPVHLMIAPQCGFDAVAVETRIEGDAGLIDVSCVGRLAAATRIEAVLTLPDGRAVQVECAPNETSAHLVVRATGCPVWSPDNPVLLPLRLLARALDGALLDQVDLRIGVREIAIADGALMLNGAPLTLRGFGKHEDSAIRGRGLDLPLLVKDLALLKWLGANSVRTAHYPYAEEFYDACDEAGVLVIGEAFAVNLDFRRTTEQTLVRHKQAVTQMIARDRNHPCVIAWSLANEPGYLGEEAYAGSGPYWRALYAHARALDPSRPLTHAHVAYAGPDDPAFAEDDFISINRYYGWYTHPAQLEVAAAALTADIDDLSGRFGKPVFVSEFGADALAGEHAAYPQLFAEEYQADLIEAYWRAIAAHPAAIGGHVWCFADFRTAQHGRRVVLNLKGVLTRDRRPKAAAFRVRALWARRAAGEDGSPWR
ncbi:MAG: glycoside hydrolase family 2 TIM barrel-domain containing protein [Hyphomonadaceae bacterium]|nr:glycoside hydrolase family 2 TIM barrel-domain containing protein [Hyphomonadaceae bacterium]